MLNYFSSPELEIFIINGEPPIYNGYVSMKDIKTFEKIIVTIITNLV